MLSVEPPANQCRPSQRSSFPASTLSTVGLNVMPPPPGGVSLTVNCSPTFAVPSSEAINGFYSPIAGKSVRISQTRSAEAFISISVRNSFIPFLLGAQSVPRHTLHDQSRDFVV